MLSVDDIIVIFLFPTKIASAVSRDGATHKEREIGLGLPHNGQRHLVTGKMQNEMDHSVSRLFAETVTIFSFPKGGMSVLNLKHKVIHFFIDYSALLICSYSLRTLQTRPPPAADGIATDKS